jgi:chromosome partitioning protein
MLDMAYVIAVANLKGGTTKSTTAAYILFALDRLGLRVMGFDADPPGSLMRWSELAGWTVPVVGLPTKVLHQRVDALSAGVDVVVIDTPPLDEQAGIVYSALRAADVIIVPVSPTTMELDRLGPILDAAEEVAPLRARPAQLRILLTRTIARANSTAAARKAIGDAGVEVMDAEIPRRETYAQAFGEVPIVLPGDPYDQAVTEIRGLFARTTEEVAR